MNVIFQQSRRSKVKTEWYGRTSSLSSEGEGPGPGVKCQVYIKIVVRDPVAKKQWEGEVQTVFSLCFWSNPKFKAYVFPHFKKKGNNKQSGTIIGTHMVFAWQLVTIASTQLSLNEGSCVTFFLLNALGCCIFGHTEVLKCTLYTKVSENFGRNWANSCSVCMECMCSACV